MIDQPQPAQLGGGEPSDRVVFFERCVDRVAVPCGDQESVQDHLRRLERNLDRPCTVDRDREFFAALSTDGVVRGLAGLDVTSDEIPDVRIRPPLRMTVTEQQLPVSDKDGCRDLFFSAVLHASTLLPASDGRCFGEEPLVVRLVDRAGADFASPVAASRGDRGDWAQCCHVLGARRGRSSDRSGLTGPLHRQIWGRGRLLELGVVDPRPEDSILE
ncbi:hypothetical protein SAMN04489812_3149 [Microlunatus soli]|uniref:Uncharacterized protein n=1 Tax=Microlunatus soli TaxID=630515 RepID=A0A1H1VD50_9ACTN|nr:hypothetical protein [Microlunatus soli]SDS82326.1 hypothetical protein SAMN04489812_3149 [Microlunatus soli]